MRKSLSSELKIVELLLLKNINALNSPLSTLIHAQLPYCYPLVRAAVALTAIDHTWSIEKSIQEHPPHIYLATALETLHLALKIHEVLINESSASNEVSPDTLSDKPQPSKTLIGGTILAGDYCFSSSARLSAKTNHPPVVEIFARALKKISEEHLAHLAGGNNTAYDTSRELFYTGIMASTALSQKSLEPPYPVFAVQLSQQLADLLQRVQAGDKNAIDIKSIGLSESEKEKWADFVVWLEPEISTNI